MSWRQAPSLKRGRARRSRPIPRFKKPISVFEGATMKPAPFEYIRPSTVEEALLALRTHADGDAKLLAGGQSLVPMMNFRVLQPTVIIDINQLHDLAYI